MVVRVMYRLMDELGCGTWFLRKFRYASYVGFAELLHPVGNCGWQVLRPVTFWQVRRCALPACAARAWARSAHAGVARSWRASAKAVGKAWRITCLHGPSNLLQ